MDKQLAQFLLPVQNGESELDECNRFLRSVKVVQLDRQFTTCGGVGCWAVLVQYMDGVQSSKSRKPRIDYREVLNEEDFRIFSNLRKMRKIPAEREGVPVYAVFINEQLARIATEKIVSRSHASAWERWNHYYKDFSFIRASNSSRVKL